jgi:hypothetical protein
MTYQLNPEAKAFTYTREELFECITKIVAHPHTAITKHDQSRALAIMVVFDDYFTNFCESDNNGSHYVYERDELEFEDFVRHKLGPEYCHRIDADEVLK